MRLSTVLSCLLLALLFNVLEAKNAHKGKFKKGLVPKHRTLKRRTELKLGEGADDFHKLCTEIFGEKTAYAHVIQGMAMAIMYRLEELCADKPIHPLIHKKLSEALLCGESLATALSKIINILFSNVPKQCYDKRGFTGYFIFTTIQNEEADDSDE